MTTSHADGPATVTAEPPAGSGGLPQQASAAVTVLVTRVAGARRLAELLGEVPARALLQRHRQCAEALAQERGGRLLQVTDEGAVLVFARAEAALQCACALQQEPGSLLALAVHRGPALQEGTALRGPVLVMASRLADRARADEVLVSEAARRAVPALAWSARESLHLEGLRRPVRVSRLLSPQCASASTASNALRAAMSTGSQTGENGGA